MKKNQANTLKEILKKNKVNSLNEVFALNQDKVHNDEQIALLKEFDVVKKDGEVVKKRNDKRRIFFTSSMLKQGTTTSILNLATILADINNKKVLCTTYNNVENVKKMQDFFFQDIKYEDRTTNYSKTFKYKRPNTESIYNYLPVKYLDFLNFDFFSNVSQLSEIANNAFNKVTKYFYTSKYDYMLIDISLEKLLEIDISSSEEIIIVTTLEEEELKNNYILAKKLLSITPHVKLFFNLTNNINDVEEVSKKILSLSDNKIEVIGSILKSDIINFNSTRNNPFFVSKNVDFPFMDFYNKTIKKILN